MAVTTAAAVAVGTEQVRAALHERRAAAGTDGGLFHVALVPGEYDTDAFITQMEEHLEKDSEEAGFRISASYGSCSTTLTESLNLDEIIVIADEQMYKMKKEKKKTE